MVSCNKFKPAIFLLSGLALICSGCVLEVEDVPHMRRMAPRVQEVLLDKFAAIDTDKDGILVESELKSARRSAGELAPVFDHAISNLGRVGHVVHEFTDLMPIITIVGDIPVTTLVPITTYTHGISRKDLESYPARVTKRYSR